MKRFGDSEWIERLGRVGLVAKGIVWAGGLLAVLVALGIGGEATDREAHCDTRQGIDGAIILVALGPGFAAYAAWRFAQAVLDRDDEGNGFEGWAKRGGALARASSTPCSACLPSPSSPALAARAATSRSRPPAFSTCRSAGGSYSARPGSDRLRSANGYRSITGLPQALKTGQMEREDVRPL